MRYTFALALACSLAALWTSPGEAKGRHATVAAAYGWGSWQPAYQAPAGFQRTGGRFAARRGAVPAVRREAGDLVAANGRSANVSAAALPHFRCLVAWLEGAGYQIDFMTGYAARPGNPSAHPTGNALDINQIDRGRVTRPFPAGVDGAARGCGLTPGSSFGDTGHFEMARKYGYVFPAGWRTAAFH